MSQRRDDEPVTSEETTPRWPCPTGSDVPALKVALLGCGVVGSSVATMLVDQRRRPRRPGRRPARPHRHRRAPPRAGAPRRPGRPVALHRRRRHARAQRRRRHRGHRRHRPGSRAHPHRDEARRLGRHRQQGAARRGRADPVRRGGRARRRPLLRGRRRRRHPDRAPDARVARRRRRRSACSASSTARPTSSSTRWTAPAPGFAETVEQAQALGYAEADPTADVEGFDAAAKAAILASLAFHTRVSSAHVHREGITEVTAADVQAAREMDAVVKLLAICELLRDESGAPSGVSVRVHPAMITRSHPLASVRDAYNAVFVEAARRRRAHVLRQGRRW